MNRWKVATILSDHVEGLIEGKDNAERLLAEHPEVSVELRPLFRLAASLQSVLVPVKAPVTFVSRLHQDLMTYSPPKPEIMMKASLSSQKLILVGVAAAGSVLSVAGIILLVIRRLRSSGETGQQAVSTAA